MESIKIQTEETNFYFETIYGRPSAPLKIEMKFIPNIGDVINLGHLFGYPSVKDSEIKEFLRSFEGAVFIVIEREYVITQFNENTPAEGRLDITLRHYKLVDNK